MYTAPERINAKLGKPSAAFEPVTGSAKVTVLVPRDHHTRVSQHAAGAGVPY